MPLRIAVALAIALAFPSGARAADAAALKVLGFSPDGRYFGFMQYGPQWEAERFHAEVFVIDVNRDRFVAGVPLRIIAKMKDDATDDNIAPHLKAFLASVQKRATNQFGQHKISKPGALLARFAEAKADEHSSGSETPAKGAGTDTISAKHPVLGELKLNLETKTIDWPKASRLGAHKEATSCAEEMDPEKGAAFRLTLERAGRSIVLHDDKTIPLSRNCTIGYGIVEVHALDRPDGKVALAVMLGMHSRGFEGSDRLFLAVTHVLDR